jgi:hypothetical protein
MGYTTDFTGSIQIEPPLNADEIDYLNKFNRSRRMNRHSGPYNVEGSEQFGNFDIIDYNDPPEGQPGLWCQWVPTEDGSQLVWDGNEKFYNSADWMEYLITHFLRPAHIANMPFLQGHICNGEIEAQGEDSDDRWKLIVHNNVAIVKQGRIIYDD